MNVNNARKPKSYILASLAGLNGSSVPRRQNLRRPRLLPSTGDAFVGEDRSAKRQSYSADGIMGDARYLLPPRSVFSPIEVGNSSQLAWGLSRVSCCRGVAPLTLPSCGKENYIQLAALGLALGLESDDHGWIRCFPSHSLRWVSRSWDGFAPDWTRVRSWVRASRRRFY